MIHQTTKQYCKLKKESNKLIFYEFIFKNKSYYYYGINPIEQNKKKESILLHFLSHFLGDLVRVIL
jgi:hypothetical protein